MPHKILRNRGSHVKIQTWQSKRGITLWVFQGEIEKLGFQAFPNTRKPADVDQSFNSTMTTSATHTDIYNSVTPNNITDRTLYRDVCVCVCVCITIMSENNMHR